MEKHGKGAPKRDKGKGHGRGAREGAQEREGQRRTLNPKRRGAEEWGRRGRGVGEKHRKGARP